MFYRSAEYNPGVDEKYSDKITCLASCNGHVFLGREDGVIECIDNTSKYKLPIFKREFDYLENDMIREQIVAIEQTTDGGISDILFVANEKSLCILRVRNDQSTLSICRSDPVERVRILSEKRCQNVHNYILNSLTLSASGNLLVSADFLRLSLWSPAHMDKCYTLVDLKPSGTKDGVSLVINVAKFSPFSEPILAWATSNGEVHVHDMNISPRSQCVATFRGSHGYSVKSISDLSFIDENLLIARSVNNVFLSDLRKPNAPIFSCDLITDQPDLNVVDSSDAIYLTYKVCSDGMYAYTGSCFGTVYSINLLTADLEEVLISPTREFCIPKRIKHVIPNNIGFSCAYDGQLLHYNREVDA